MCKVDRDDNMLLTGLSQVFPTARIERVRSGFDHVNSHWLVERGNGERSFVKVAFSKPEYHEAEIAAFRLVTGTRVRAPRLINHGTLSGGPRWTEFSWEEMEMLDWDRARARVCGERLAQFHALSLRDASAEIRRHPPLAEHLVRARATILDKSVAARFADLFVPDLDEDALTPSVLLHGDFGHRNIGWTRSNQAVVFDLEHVAIGDRAIDFGKLWDRELKDRSIRKAFLSGYETAGGSVPHETTLRAVRVWSMGLLYQYGETTEDSSALAHAAEVLGILEGEAP